MAKKPTTTALSSVRHDTLPLSALAPHPRNYRRHPQAQIARLAASLARFGQVRSIVVQEGAPGRYLIVAGHGIAEAAKTAGITELHADVIPADWTPEQCEGYLLADNMAGADDDLVALAELLEAQQNAGFDLESVGSSADDLAALLEELAEAELDGADGDTLPDDEDESEGASAPKGNLADQFGVPPFSVLDARQGYWQARKRAWIALGIQSELGRGGNIGAVPPNERDSNSRSFGGKSNNGLLGESEQARSHYHMGATPASDGRGGLSNQLAPRTEATASFKAQSRLTALQRTGDSSRAVDYGTAGNVSAQSGTSIFDPVLCELAYRWFSPTGGTVLDPFAGGSVRGIVASKTGRIYHGLDLRAEQIAANEEQAARICADNEPRWYVGDSRNMDTVLPAEVQADLLFTCPPYYDLEVYSDNPQDLSTAGTYADFLAAYEDILGAALARLRPDRFACVVVGDIRDARGYYRNFVSDTISIMERHGARLYNEAILVTAVGSLPVRAGRVFSASRKLGKTHQNVLVFCKGDPARAVAACGAVEVPNMDAYEADLAAASLPSSA